MEKQILRTYVIVLLIGMVVGYGLVVGNYTMTGRYNLVPDWRNIKQCSDGIDNDGDSWIDWPFDPGCEGKVDNTEYDYLAPECSDGQDNDNDNRVDYPADLQCKSPTDNIERR